MELTALVLFAFVTVLALSAVGGTMGWRILRNAQRAGGTPEIWVGRALLMVCAAGYPLLILGQLIPQLEIRAVFVIVGIGAAHLGVACIFVFTRVVFRPTVAWLRPAVWIAVTALVATWLSGALVINWPLRHAPAEALIAGLPWAIASNAITGLGMAWSAIEALRQWQISARRARIGLADPLVANRMLLWATFTGSSFIVNMTHGITAARGVDPGADPPSIAIAGVLSLVSTTALWLAFLPPKAWIDRIRGGAAGSGT